MTDVLGHVATIFLIMGLVFVGRKNHIGWLLRIVGEVLWIALGMHMGMTSIWVWGIVFTAISYHHWRNWKCESSNRESTTAAATGP